MLVAYSDNVVGFEIKSLNQNFSPDVLAQFESLDSLYRNEVAPNFSVDFCPMEEALPMDVEA